MNLAERRRLSCLFAKNVLIIVIQQPFPYDKNVIENPHFSDVAKMSIDMDGKMVGTGMGKNNLNAKLENDGKMVGGAIVTKKNGHTRRQIKSNIILGTGERIKISQRKWIGKIRGEQSSRDMIILR